jgi:hypothetical protein
MCEAEEEESAYGIPSLSMFVSLYTVCMCALKEQFHGHNEMESG